MDIASVSISDNKNLLFNQIKTNVKKEEPLQNDNSILQTDISDLAKIFYESGIDPKTSWVSKSFQRLNFSFNFLNEKTEKLTADGFYSEEKKALNISFQYSFESIEERDGKMFRRKYQIDFGMNLSDVKKESLTGSIKKEDLLEYIKRVVERIFEVADDEEISIGKLLFEKEDIAEIEGMEDKKTREAIINLLSTAIAVAKLKEFYNDRKDSKTVDFGVEREKYLEIVKHKERMQNRESWLNISETLEEISEEKDAEQNNSFNNPAEDETANTLT